MLNKLGLFIVTTFAEVVIILTFFNINPLELF